MGLLVIATNRYTEFVGVLVESARRFFMRGELVTIYVFTDRPERVPPGVETCLVEHRKWPFATLLRYHHIEQYRDRLSDEDFLYQCDADMRFVGPVGREALPGKARGLVGVEHPAFCWRPNVVQWLWRNGVSEIRLSR